MDEDLLARARVAFGWDGDIEVFPGPRGALGQIWQLHVGSVRYALKEIFAEPPTEELMRVEREFVGRARNAHVRVPLSHPGRDGRHVFDGPGGTWFRCDDWIDLYPVSLTATETPGQLGTLLARLHRCASAAALEPHGGGPPDPWFDSVPSANEWADACVAAAPWAERLASATATLPQLCAAVTPADEARLVLCHRDLHPENVLADGTGELVVVDWGDLGPAEPSRELGRALFDWFCTEDAVDVDAIRETVESYVREGGPGRVTATEDFTMLLACRLNFLAEQIGIAVDPRAERRHRGWAEHEIERSLHVLPTPRQLDLVLAAVRDSSPSADNLDEAQSRIGRADWRATLP